MYYSHLFLSIQVSYCKSNSSLGCRFFRYLLNRAVVAVLNWMADVLESLAARALGNDEAGPLVANDLRNLMIEVLRHWIVEALWNYATEALGLL